MEYLASSSGVTNEHLCYIGNDAPIARCRM